LLRSRWASSWSTMVLKKNTPRLRNNIQSNAKTASALTAHWCVEASFSLHWWFDGTRSVSPFIILHNRSSWLLVVSSDQFVLPIFKQGDVP
jgi:hypothetical protein